MRTKYRNLNVLDQRLYVPLTAEQKTKVFELADREQTSVASIVRRALATLLEAA